MYQTSIIALSNTIKMTITIWSNGGKPVGFVNKNGPYQTQYMDEIPFTVDNMPGYTAVNYNPGKHRNILKHLPNSPTNQGELGIYFYKSKKTNARWQKMGEIAWAEVKDDGMMTLYLRPFQIQTLRTNKHDSLRILGQTKKYGKDCGSPAAGVMRTEPIQ